MLLLGWQDGQLGKVLTMPETAHVLSESIDNPLALPSQAFLSTSGIFQQHLTRQELLGSSEVQDPFCAQEYCSVVPVCAFVDLADTADTRKQVQK